MLPEDLSKIPATQKARQKKFLQKLKQKKYKDLDQQFQDCHDEVFAEFDCLTCANCCKTISPIFKSRDIDRISKVLRMSRNEFIDNYLRLDEDHDYVLRKTPCPFLEEGNLCSIYEFRPEACAEYPHTNSRRAYQLLGLTEKNVTVCQAAFLIVEKLQEKYPS